MSSARKQTAKNIETITELDRLRPYDSQHDTQFILGKSKPKPARNLNTLAGLLDVVVLLFCCFGFFFEFSFVYAVSFSTECHT